VNKIIAILMSASIALSANAIVNHNDDKDKLYAACINSVMNKDVCLCVVEYIDVVIGFDAYTQSVYSKKYDITLFYNESALKYCTESLIE
jgi:hypothetical protein